MERAGALREVAQRQAVAGDVLGARQTFALALDTAAGFGAYRERCKGLLAVVRVQAQAGDIQGALSTAWRLSDEDERGWALSAIAAAQASRGDRPGALETAGHIRDEGEYSTALSAVGRSLAQAGDSQGAQEAVALALDAAQVIREEQARARVSSAIAQAQAVAGFAQDALRTAESIRIDRHQHLPEIAALALRGPLEPEAVQPFKDLLPPCSLDLGAALRVCGCLGALYPQHVRAIVGLLQALPTGSAPEGNT